MTLSNHGTGKSAALQYRLPSRGSKIGLASMIVRGQTRNPVPALQANPCCHVSTGPAYMTHMTARAALRPVQKFGEPASNAALLRAGDTWQLLRPPSSQAGLPSWWLPAAMVLAGSDVASGLINPALPAFLAVSVAATATSGAHRHSAAKRQTQDFLPKRQGLPPCACVCKAPLRLLCTAA